MSKQQEAMRLALEVLEDWDSPVALPAMVALRAALAEYDKDRVKVEEMKANWALQRKLAEETQERDKQQREYEEQRLAALAEPVQEPVAFDHGIGADRFRVVRGAFWWHVLIGDSPTEHGKFRSRAGAEKMAADLLREFRNGAFVQHEAALAEPDLFHCPKCGGPADNGHDRSIPPSPYWCSKCMAEP